MTAVEAFAPAKINLTLHVTGQRDDGYHLIDSLVAFADVGDTVTVRPSDRLQLICDGPFGDRLPAGEDNLVVQAARLLDPNGTAEITLTKRLPPASGIGGGSADAAAALRALSQLWGLPLPAVDEVAALGADVPVCLRSGFTRMRGIGETLDLLGPTPGFGLVLVNPGVEVSTPAVFKALAQKDNPPMDGAGDATASWEDWIAWLTDQRNDLEAPAISLAPVIGTILEELRALSGCRLARMSGSGATCFALFDPGATVDASAIAQQHPDWWVTETRGFLSPFRM